MPNPSAIQLLEHPGDDLHAATLALNGVQVRLNVSGTQWVSAKAYSRRQDPLEIFAALRDAVEDGRIRCGLLKEGSTVYFQAASDSCDFTGCWINPA